MRWPRRRERLTVVLRSHDAKGKVHKRRLKINRKFDMLIPYFVDILGLSREDLKTFLKEKFASLLERMSSAWKTLERETNMSTKEIIDRCKKDETFRERSRKILNSVLFDEENE